MRQRLQRSTLWLGLPVLLLLFMALSLRFGAVPAGWADVAALISGGESEAREILRDYRLPRTAAAAVIGVYLSLAGLVFQTVLRNPLADPTIFGVAGGASLAVVAAMALMIALHPTGAALQVTTSYLPLAAVPPIALAGGLVATALVFALAWRGGFSALRLVLIGVVLAALLQGVVMAMVLTLSETRTELAILWLAGSLYARDFGNVLPALPWGVAGIIVIVLMLPVLSALRFDTDTANAMGVPVRWAAPGLLAVAAALAAVAISIAGPVGFVGLIVPHMTRLLVGPSLQHQLWGAALIGACLVIASDTLGRAIAPPLEIPVGIVTSLIGAPVFALQIRLWMKREAND